MTALHARSWHGLALCAQTDPALFFPQTDQPAGLPVTICHRCPARQECLDDAINTGDIRFGIRGGKTPRERQQIALAAQSDEKLCPVCGTPPGKWRTYCKPCAAERIRAAKRISAPRTKTCPVCDRPAGYDRTYCLPCAETRTLARQQNSQHRKTAA